MERPSYLNKYLFDWELFDVIIGGKSALDAHTFLGPVSTREEVWEFLDGYGFNRDNQVSKAELFGNFQESLQFIRRYFLRENNPEGLELTVPNTFYTFTMSAKYF